MTRSKKHKRTCSARKHGHSRQGAATKEYRSWTHILDRCNNPKCKQYRHYGGRGIKVEYRGFPEFLADLGKAPSPDHSVDRIDNDGNYRPGNCRWATRLMQASNRQGNVFLTARGKTQTIGQWSRETGIPYITIWQRKFVRGFDDEKCVAPKRTVRGWFVALHCGGGWVAYRGSRKTGHRKYLGYFANKKDAIAAATRKPPTALARTNSAN